MSAHDRVLEELEKRGRVRSQAGYHMAQCPAHEDNQASLSVKVGTDGRVLLHCHAGCDPAEVVAQLGLTLGDLFEKDDRSGAKPIRVAEYRYTDEHGDLLFVKERYVPKTFRVRRANGEYGLGDTPRVLYRLPDVVAAVKDGRTVWVVEGEKDADRLAALGEVATCNFDGAAKDNQRPKWRGEYNRWLAGAARVVVIPDRDAPGRAHAAAIARSLAGAVRDFQILEPAAGNDVSDHLDAGLTLVELLPPAEPEDLASPGDSGDRWADIASQYEPIDWKRAFAEAPDETPWLVRPFVAAGRLVALYSPPKAGKSLLMLEIAASLAAGEPVLGNPAAAPMSVLYVDIENTVEDLVDRLQDMGFTPGQLAFLHYYSFPGLPALDSETGGEHLLALALHHQAVLVIIDTVSRVVSGSENDSDTFLALYRHALVPLKANGIAVVRLDHSGKDLERGQRGSSAKSGDVDAVWQMVARSPVTVDLRLQESRGQNPVQQMTLRREGGPLRHHLTTAEVIGPEVRAAIAEMDRLGLPDDTGNPVAKVALREAGYKASNKVIEEAVRARKDPSRSAFHTPDVPRERHLSVVPAVPEMQDRREGAGTTAPGTSETAGQGFPGNPGGTSGTSAGEEARVGSPGVPERSEGTREPSPVVPAYCFVCGGRLDPAGAIDGCHPGCYDEEHP